MTQVNEGYRQADIRTELAEIAKELRDLREDRNQGRDGEERHHACGVRMLEHWGRLAAFTGNADLARQAGVKLSDQMQAIPPSWRSGPSRVELRAQLGRLLEGVRGIRNGTEENADGQTGEDAGSQDELGSAWDQMAELLGHGRMALEQAREQPVVRYNEIGHDPYRALGVALFHAENAMERYRIIAKSPGIRGVDAMHSGAERETRLAHRVLWLVTQETRDDRGARAPEDKRTMARFIQRYAGRRHTEMAEARRDAAAVLGLPEPASQGLDRLDI